jgi:hypothetical protein
MATIQLNRTKTGAVPPSLNDGELYIDQLNGLLYWTDATAGMHSFPLLGVLAQSQIPALTGDVTKASGNSATTIAAKAVTNAKMADMPTLTLKGNGTGGTAAPADLTAAQVKALLALTSADVGAFLVPIRQSLISGPMTAAGLGNFLPATSGGLSVQTQNLTLTPLVVTAAQGFNDSGAKDYLRKFSTDQTWGGLTANSTCYLYINANTGSLGFTTREPIYQFAGTPSNINGQFTFNIGQMTGYMGNGSAAPATPLIFIGEAVTNATAVTSTTAYSYGNYYDTGWTNTLPSTITDKTHNLGGEPQYAKMILECITPEGGYSAGDQLFSFTANDILFWSNPTLITRKIARIAPGNLYNFQAPQKSALTFFNMTNANWKYKIVVARGW